MQRPLLLLILTILISPPPCPKQGSHAPNWYVTACKRSENREVFVIHSDEVDEAALLNAVFCPKRAGAQPASPLPSAPGGGQPQPGPRIVSKPNAARHLGLG